MMTWRCAGGLRGLYAASVRYRHRPAAMRAACCGRVVAALGRGMLVDTMAMDFGRLPVDVQVAAFQAVLLRNPTLAEVLARAAVVDLPGWYLVAGCLYQT